VSSVGSLQKSERLKAWLKKVASINEVQIGGISDLSQKKIAFGLEKYGRPVTLANSHMKRYVTKKLKEQFNIDNLPTKEQFINALEGHVLEVVIDRIQNAGGDLSATWSAHPLTKKYAAYKRKKWGARPMGQASRVLLRELQKRKAFALAKGIR
jgi:RNA:NAD 2'-phosphotransferase (TPT1/KptA family)